MLPCAPPSSSLSRTKSVVISLEIRIASFEIYPISYPPSNFEACKSVLVVDLEDSQLLSTSSNHHRVLMLARVLNSHKLTRYWYK